MKGFSASRTASLMALILVSTTGFLPLSVLAKEEGITEQTGRLEQTLFGYQRPGDPLEIRVQRLEAGLYGSFRSGSIAKRLHKMDQKLGVKPGRSASMIAPPSPAETKPEPRTADLNLTAPPPRTELETHATATTAAPPPETASESASVPGQGNTQVLGRDNTQVGPTQPSNSLDQFNQSLPAHQAAPETAAQPKPSATKEAAAAKTVPAARPVATSKATSPGKPSAISLKAGTPKEDTRPLSTLGSNKTRSPANAADQAPKVDPSRSAMNSGSSQTLFPNHGGKQLLRLGMQKFSEGNYAEAEEYFRRVLISDPNNVDALFNLGALAERQGDLIMALGNYRAALSITPADSELKQAVLSVEQQLKQQDGKNRPLLGNALLNDAQRNPLLQAQNPSNGVYPVQVGGGYPANVNPTNWPIVPVSNPMPIPTVPVSTPNHTGRSTVGLILRMGAMSVPGLHCPMCRLLGGF